MVDERRPKFDPGKEVAIAPIIETERLRLRPHKLADLSDMFSMWSDPDIVEHISGVPSTLRETWLRMLQYTGHWQHLGFGYWAIEKNSDRQYIGEIGLANFRRGLSPSLLDIPEAGWCIAKPYQGAGYAKEALIAALNWADHVACLDQSVCLIVPENGVSISLANTLGFTFTEKVSNSEQELLVFKRERPRISGA